MATKEVKVPDIGDFDEVPVIEVLVKEGDEIEKEQSLITLESEKATMEVPAPFAGTVKEVKVKENDNVAQGSVILVVEPREEGAAGDQGEGESEERDSGGGSEKPEEDSVAKGEGADKDADKNEEEAEEDDEAQKKDDDQDTKNDKEVTEDKPRDEAPDQSDDEDLSPADLPHASPAVRAFARKLGVELKRVKGSGPKGRITKEDVQGHVKRVIQGSGSAANAMGVAPPPKVDFSKYGPVQREPLSRIRRIGGANLHRNWVTIPHVTQHDEADITDLEAFRKAQQEVAKAQNAKLTMVSFLVKASVAALKQFPRFNSSLDETGERLVMKQYFHIGVAVETDNGLVVPVLRDCDQKGLIDLALELGELSRKARDGKLSPGDMQGACFSISSLGGIGGTAFTPIVNLPEVAILGVSRAAMKPAWDGNEFQPRLMLPLSLSYDHRVIDGADAARFTRYLAGALSDLRRILL